MASYSNPLTDEHCACLDRMLQSAAETHQLLTDCKDCFGDHPQLADHIAGLMEQNNMHRSIGGKIKAKFFPHRS